MTIINTLRQKNEFMIRHVGTGRLDPVGLKRSSQGNDTYIHGFNGFQVYRFLHEDDGYMYFETPGNEKWEPTGWKLEKASLTVHVHVTHQLRDLVIDYQKQDYEFFVKLD